jgi:hypothetical protein
VFFSFLVFLFISFDSWRWKKVLVAGVNLNINRNWADLFCWFSFEQNSDEAAEVLVGILNAEMRRNNGEGVGDLLRRLLNAQPPHGEEAGGGWKEKSRVGNEVVDSEIVDH